MKNQNKRMKASDVYRESMFATFGSFEKAYPQIETLLLEVKESSAVKVGETSIRTYTLANIPGVVVDCSNPLCYGGGFSIEGMLHDMVKNGETKYTTTLRCHGYEGSPKGVKKYGDCMHFFEITLLIKYRE